MQTSVPLPPLLQKHYDEIAEAFDAVAGDWRKYDDEIIPEDIALAKKIIDFLIAVVEYMETRYEKIDAKAWGQFLREYYYGFYYGPMGDDRNYLDFDEAPIADILLAIPFEKKINKEQVASLKKKLVAARKKFN